MRVFDVVGVLVTCSVCSTFALLGSNVNFNDLFNNINVGIPSIPINPGNPGNIFPNFAPPPPAGDSCDLTDEIQCDDPGNVCVYSSGVLSGSETTCQLTNVAPAAGDVNGAACTSNSQLFRRRIFRECFDFGGRTGGCNGFRCGCFNNECQCNSEAGYFPVDAGPSGTVCLKAKDLCEYADFQKFIVCNIGLYSILGPQASRCDCAEGVPIFENSACSTNEADHGESCSVTGECIRTNSVCKEGTCSCPDYYVYTGSEYGCQRKKKYHENCLHTSQCTDYLEYGECVDGEVYAKCVCPEDRPVFKREEGEEYGYCVPKVSYGDECYIDEQCGFYCGKCEDGYCVCPEDSFFNGEDWCIRKTAYQAKCTEGESKCFTENAVCGCFRPDGGPCGSVISLPQGSPPVPPEINVARCRCPPTTLFYDDGAYGKCVPGSLGIGEECHLDKQCLHEYSYCGPQGTCICKPNFKLSKEGDCIYFNRNDPPRIGDRCAENSDCNVNPFGSLGLLCIPESPDGSAGKYRCRCPPGAPCNNAIQNAFSNNNFFNLFNNFLGSQSKK